MKLLGIDFGAKRVGVAITDEEGKIAFPKLVLANDPELVSKIKALCDSEKVAGVIIGESLNYQGQVNPIMTAINEFVAKLKTMTEVEIVFEPEFMTSQQASRLQGENSQSDASAAAIILQSYLDRN